MHGDAVAIALLKTAVLNVVRIKAAQPSAGTLSSLPCAIHQLQPLLFTAGARAAAAAAAIAAAAADPDAESETSCEPASLHVGSAWLQHSLHAQAEWAGRVWRSYVDQPAGAGVIVLRGGLLEEVLVAADAVIKA
eukprot:362896-Chlamydomonas_euryale.AAC.1